MKKSFTLFSVSALFLMLLFPVSVKADPIVLNFGYHDGEWTQNGNVAQPAECCAGYIAASDKIVTGSDFYYSGKHQDAVERDGDNWTGFNGSNGTVMACTRAAVSLSASTTYTFSLLTKDKGEMEITLPKISIDGTNYVRPQKVLVNSVEQSFSNNQYRYTNNEETVLEYSITAPSSSSYTVSVQFTSGYRDKFKASTLTITQNAATYAVTVNNDGNGTASADKAKYEAGETVTLTAEPNANYLFNGWTTSDDGFSFVDGQSASTTFTMPAKAVTVQANFVACSGQTVTVNVNDGNMGSATGGGSYCAGVQVDLEATPKSSYRFVNWIVTSGSADINDVNSASAHFTMSNPAAAVTVQANFELDPCTNTKTIQCEDYVSYNTKPSGSKDNKPENLKSKDYIGYGNPIGGYYADFDGSTGEMWIPVTLPAGTFTFTVRYVKGGNNMWFNLYDVSNNSKIANSKQLSQKGDSWDSDVSNSYTLTSGDYVIGIYGNDNYTGLDQITITATSNVFCPNTITMAKSGDDGAAAPTAQVNSSNVTTAFEGATVTVTAAAASAGYNFSGWTASPEVTFADASATSTTFTMPANAVTITANYEESVSSTFTYTISGSGSIICATTSGSSVVSGTAIPMTAVPSTDYVFTGWTATAGGTFSNAYEPTTTFTMPSTAAEVTANFAQVDNIICYGVESGSAGDGAGGGATISGSNIQDFDAFDGNNIVKLSYAGMSGSSAYASWDILKSNTYNSANSAGATGFGFYYKTEAADDKVAMWFEPNTGGQQALQLNGTSNVWKYVYFAHSAAATWNQSQIRIYINGEQEGKSTANANGAIYLADIAATSITSKPDINSYTYTREKASNSYGTLCLPMAGTVSGATLYSVAGKQEEGGKLYIVLEEQGATLAAGEPYIFETDGSTLTATMSGPHSPVKADANGLVGTYQQITAPAYSASDNLNYVLALDDSNNTVFKKVGENVTVGAYRAYINIQNADNYSPASAAPGRKYIRFGIEGTEEAQAVEMIYDDASLRTRKIMQNGHLYILRDGHLFTAQGTQIK